MRLVIGNKNYSSWSMRPWFLLKHARIKFEEVRIPLFTSDGERMLDELCPAKQVPVLYDGRLVLWDSLAICEYIADKYPDKKLWPGDASARAHARAMSAEMHSGFHHLRTNMPMNCRRRVDEFKPNDATVPDVERMQQLLKQALEDSGGPWLFGHFTVADAMFAPIASRFQTYGITCSAPVGTYFNKVLSSAAMMRWFEDALHETEIIEQSEV